MLRSLVSVGLLLGLAPGLAIAQSPWSSLPVPTGVVSAQATSQGKLAVYRDGGTLHAWSAVTRRWASLAVSAPPALYLNNDCLLVIDGGSWTAFSSYGGGFVPLTTAANPTLLNGAAAVNDSVLLVADATHVHAFSAFAGTWSARPLAGAYSASVQRHVAIVAQANVVSAFNAFTGTWHDLAVAVTPAAVSADGTAAVAYGSGRVYAFSALHGVWREHPALPGAAFARGDDWAVWYTNNMQLGFSAIRAGFGRAHHAVSTPIFAEDLFGMFDGAGGVFAFSAFTGTFSGVVAAPGTVVARRSATAVLVDGAGTRAYSAVVNAAFPCPIPAVSSGLGTDAAWVRDSSGPPWFFSSLLGAWYAPPPDVVAVDAVVAANCVGAVTTTGCVAFAPRTGAFVPLADGTATLQANPSSAPLFATGSSSLHAFDERRASWTSIARAGTGPTSVSIWRTGGIVFDGLTAFAYGAQAGSWSVQALPGPVISQRANSESQRLDTANAVFVWSALGEVSSIAQFPEFRRVQPGDAPARFCVRLDAGNLAVLGLGALAGSPLPLAGLGDLWLEPGGIATALLAGGTNGAPVQLAVAAPTSLALTGWQFAVQACVLGAAQPAYLTDAAVVTLW